MDKEGAFRDRCVEVFGERFVATDPGIDTFNMGIDCLKAGGIVIQGLRNGSPCTTVVLPDRNLRMAVDWFTEQTQNIRIRYGRVFHAARR